MYKMERTDNYLMFLENDTIIEPYISYLDTANTKAEPVKTQPTPSNKQSYIPYLLLSRYLAKPKDDISWFCNAPVE